MDWTASTLWWLAAAGLVAAELATGTFYLLMLALGASAAALASQAGWGFSAQLLSAALVGGGAVVLWHLRKIRRPAPAPAAANHDVNLDIGAKLHVSQWRADGSARVNYRGAGWEVRFAGQGAPESGDYVIRSVEGSCLMLDRA